MIELPEEYKRVIYIESDFTQIIDTGFVLKNNSRVVVDFQSTGNNSNQNLFGGRIATTSRTFTFGEYNQQRRVGWNNSTSTYGIADTNRHTVDFDGKNLIVKLDGNTLTTLTSATYTTPISSLIFGVQSTSVYYYGYHKIYRAAFYDDGILVRDLIPCYRISDGIGGLYDVVNGVFYENIGTGDFIIGPDVLPLKIVGNIKVGNNLSLQGGEIATAYQRYRDGDAIEDETNSTYTLKITDQGHDIACAVIIDGEIQIAESIYVDYYNLEVKPIEKEYIYKLYDKDMNFLKVIQTSIVISDLSFSETINSGQGQVVLNLNLPIDTDYLNDVRYLKIFVSDNSGIENQLLFSGYLSKYSRIFSNNKENIQATFLSLFSLLSDITFKNAQGEDTFTVEGIDPAQVIKDVIDYFSESYPGILTYTNTSIQTYGNLINLEVKNQNCLTVISNILDGLNFYLFVGADGLVQFKEKPAIPTHYFTYEKDITALTIPEDYEQVVNAVRIQYGYIGGPHTGITDRAEDSDSIAKYGRKEQTIVNTSLYGNESAVIYRDSYLNKNSSGKQNISITINNKYQIETIHPGDTVSVRNLNFEISNLQVYSIQYQYEQAILKLEYSSSLGQEILSLTA